MEQRDSFSYQCGVVDAFNEMVAAEVKALALSHPMDTREEMEALIAYAHESCHRHGTKLYPECDPLITDLFPASLNRGKYNILFYKADHVIEEYIRLKDRKAATVEAGAYFGGNRSRIARDYGRLLSYPEETIRRLLSENTDRE